MGFEVNLLVTEASDHWYRMSITTSTRRIVNLTSNDVVLGTEGNDKWELAASNVGRAVNKVRRLQLRSIERRGYARS